MGIEIPITPKQLMEVHPGPELNDAVTVEVGNFVLTSGANWSTDPVAAMGLMDLIEDHVDQVAVVRFGADCPLLISQLASIGPEKESTFVYTSSWMESLCKAFLLYRNGYTGDCLHPLFEEKMRNAPKRIVN